MTAVAPRTSPGQLRVAQANARKEVVCFALLTRALRAVGTLDYAAPGVTHIRAKFDGRIESLIVDRSGMSVAAGDVMAVVYGPDLAAAHEQLILAKRRLDEAESRSSVAAVSRAAPLVAIAATQFRRWGFPEFQIEQLSRYDAPTDTVELLAPTDSVVTAKHVSVGDYAAEGTPLFDLADPSQTWLVVSIFESDLPSVREGLVVRATTDAVPGRTFMGRIDFVCPNLHAESHAAELRVELDPDGELPPVGTTMDVVIDVPIRPAEDVSVARAIPHKVYVCPMHNVQEHAPGECKACGGMRLLERDAPPPPEGAVLAVRASAVIDTGRGRIVYVECEPGVFELRAVELGPRCDDAYPVLAGLAEGERVAISAAFLLDAEARLDPAIAGTYFGAGGGPPRDDR